METTSIPTRFEDEFPEEAKILVKLCANKKLREAVQVLEDKYPKSERLYPNISDTALALREFKYSLFGVTSKGSYERSKPKVGRNDLCPCGSGKKYKKCCIMKTI